MGNLKRVTEEIEAGVDLDDGGDAKVTALHKASDRGRGEVVRALLEAGATPDIAHAKTQDTPLHLAAVAGHTEVVSELLRAGADVNAGNRLGWTPLHGAMYSNQLEIARLLVRAGADASLPNAAGVAPNMMTLRCDPHVVDAITESAKHTADLGTAAERPDFDALRARRLEASQRQVDERLEQRRQDSEGRAEQQAARTAERVEREQELHFELEASVRGCADVLDSTTDYSHITAEDEPDLMVSKNRRRSRGEKDTPGSRRKKTPQERKRERQLVMKKAVQAKAARERAFNTLARANALFVSILLDSVCVCRGPRRRHGKRRRPKRQRRSNSASRRKQRGGRRRRRRRQPGERRRSQQRQVGTQFKQSSVGGWPGLSSSRVLQKRRRRSRRGEPRRRRPRRKQRLLPRPKPKLPLPLPPLPPRPRPRPRPRRRPRPRLQSRSRSRSRRQPRRLRRFRPNPAALRR